MPGEREELHLRPSPSGFAKRYALGLLWPLWSCAALTMLASQRWVATLGNDQEAVVQLLVATGPLAVGAFLVWRRRVAWALALAAGVGAAAAIAIVILPRLGLGDPGPIWRTAAGYGLLVLPAALWVDVRRATTHYHLTTLRIVVRTSVPRRFEQTLHYSDIADVDARKYAWGDTGTIQPILARPPTPAAPAAPAPRLVGVKPFFRVRTLLGVLIQRATATEWLRAEQRLDQQVQDALAALQRA
jgi:hypothetical protein